MANDYNLTFSDFVTNSDKVMKSGFRVYIKEQQTAGNDSSDTVTVYDLGLCVDEKPLKIKREFAELKRNGSLVRKDPKSQEITLELTFDQFDRAHLALALGRYMDGTTGSSDRVLLGSEYPPTLSVSLILEGQLIDGTAIAVFLRNVQLNAEDVELALGNPDEYAGIKITGDCLPDPHPLSNNPDWDFAGTVSLTGCGTTSGDATVTKSTTSDIYVGMRVIGDGVPAGAYILSIVPSTSFELSANATATAASVSLLGEDMFATRALYEDIGYIAIARAA